MVNCQLPFCKNKTKKKKIVEKADEDQDEQKTILIKAQTMHNLWRIKWHFSTWQPVERNDQNVPGQQIV